MPTSYTSRFSLSMLRPSRLRLARAFLLLLATTACAGGDATAPTPPPGKVTPPPLMIGNAAILVDVLTDGSERIVPGLPAGPERDDLAATIRLLTNAVQAGLVVQVRSTLDGVNASIARFTSFMQGDAGADAELDALRLAMDLVALELTAATGS